MSRKSRSRLKKPSVMLSSTATFFACASCKAFSACLRSVMSIFTITGEKDCELARRAYEFYRRAVDMQERGDLLKDEEGRWVTGPELDWNALPARVEGVLEERIARIRSEARELLTIASVEGETFTAQVISIYHKAACAPGLQPRPRPIIVPSTVR